jgi:hypothetical protein
MWHVVSVVYFTGKGLCVGLITRPEESYRVCVCMCVCVRVLFGKDKLNSQMLLSPCVCVTMMVFGGVAQHLCVSGSAVWKKRSAIFVHKMCSTEPSRTSHQTKQRHIPEDQKPHLHLCRYRFAFWSEHHEIFPDICKKN